MRRIAVINQKGGVGKTTTTANLGAAVARMGRRVMLADLDPQAHLSLHYGTELSAEQPSVYDVLTSSLPVRDAAIEVSDRVWLLPSDIDLAGVESELVSVPGRELILKEAVDAYAEDIDVLLIDCPPSLGTLTVNALVAADELLIPLQAQFFALQGLSKLLDTVMLVRRRINPALRVTGIALCMHEAATRLAGEVVADLTSFLTEARGTDVPWADAQLFETPIRRNIKLAEASSFGQTIFDYAPRSNGAADYAALAAEMFPEFVSWEGEATGGNPPEEVPDVDTQQVDKPSEATVTRAPPEAAPVDPATHKQVPEEAHVSPVGTQAVTDSVSADSGAPVEAPDPQPEITIVPPTVGNARDPVTVVPEAVPVEVPSPPAAATA